MKFLAYRDSEGQPTPGLLRDGLMYSRHTAALPDLEAVLRAGSIATQQSAYRAGEEMTVAIDNIEALRNPIA